MPLSPPAKPVFRGSHRHTLFGTSQRNRPHGSYTALERPPHQWKGYSLASFDRSAYLRRPKERDGIFYTNQHLVEYRWLINYYQAQIKDIEHSHSKELRLLSRKKAIALNRCRVKDRVAITKEFEDNFDVLRFQQLWEKSLIYCRLRIELHHLRSNCRRKLLDQPEFTGPEKESWNEGFLNTVRREQWETLLRIKTAFSREGETFPEYLRAPFGQSFESYFGKFGVKFGWYRAGELGAAVDGTGTAAFRNWPPGELAFSDSFTSESLTPEESTLCAKARRVSRS